MVGIAKQTFTAVGYVIKVRVLGVGVGGWGWEWGGGGRDSSSAEKLPSVDGEMLGFCSVAEVFS